MNFINLFTFNEDMAIPIQNNQRKEKNIILKKCLQKIK